jgi:hypothetical protein
MSALKGWSDPAPLQGATRSVNSGTQGVALGYRPSALSAPDTSIPFRGPYLNLNLKLVLVGLTKGSARFNFPLINLLRHFMIRYGSWSSPLALISQWVGPYLEMHDLARCAFAPFDMPYNSFVVSRPNSAPLPTLGRIVDPSIHRTRI